METVERVQAPDRIMGAPDGPFRFIPEFGCEVPTFLDPRKDLIHPQAYAFKRLDYHVPFNKRGPFKPQWLDPKYYAQYGRQFPVDHEGFAICQGMRTWAGTSGVKLEKPQPCGKRAVNRSPYCANHGGALHPADKKISGQNLMMHAADQSRIDQLDRVQKFAAGILSIKDLDDDEIIGAYVRNDEGRPISASKLGDRFGQQMLQELIARMNRFMQMKLPNMIKAMTDIAESDFAEPADRIKAAQWVAERVIGKVPDLIALSVSNSPVDQILGQIQGGSREDYRRSIEAKRVDSNIIDVPVVDDEIDLEPTEFTVEGSSGVLDQSSSVGVRGGDAAGKRTDSDTGVVARVDAAVAARDRAKAVKRQIKLGKNKRFAMRAQGVQMSGDVAWLIEWKAHSPSGGFIAKLVPPEQQTEAKLAKMAQNANDEIVRSYS